MVPNFWGHPVHSKLWTSNLTCMLPGTVRTWSLKIFKKRAWPESYDPQNSLGGYMHSLLISNALVSLNVVVLCRNMLVLWIPMLSKTLPVKSYIMVSASLNIFICHFVDNCLRYPKQIWCRQWLGLISPWDFRRHSRWRPATILHQ